MRAILGRVFALSVALVACGGAKATDVVAAEPEPPLSADVGELELRGDGIDRFTTCPPPGQLGQHWIPNIPAWTPPAIIDAGATTTEVVHRSNDYTAAEMASEITHHDLRSCYLKGLVHHPTEDGRVALVLRVDAAGRVAKVEPYGACELAAESIECMVGVAKKLQFEPPASGSDTVTIPASFTSRDGVRRTVPTSNDAYTAGAYVTLDAARAQLHACVSRFHVAGTFTLDIKADGRVTKTSVSTSSADDQTPLKCAARVLEGLTFPAPTGGNSKVIARLNFNPRQGNR